MRNKEVIQSEKSYSNNNFGDIMFITFVEAVNAQKNGANLSDSCTLPLILRGDISDQLAKQKKDDSKRHSQI